MRVPGVYTRLKSVANSGTVRLVQLSVLTRWMASAGKRHK